jgi:hypothetical protein
MKSIKSVSVCGLGKLGACMAATFAATADNNPVLRDFEFLSDLNGLRERKDVDLAVVCCPWPQYRDLKFSSATKVLSTWQL